MSFILENLIVDFVNSGIETFCYTMMLILWTRFPVLTFSCCINTPLYWRSRIQSLKEIIILRINAFIDQQLRSWLGVSFLHTRFHIHPWRIDLSLPWWRKTRSLQGSCPWRYLKGNWAKRIGYWVSCVWVIGDWRCVLEHLEVAGHLANVELWGTCSRLTTFFIDHHVWFTNGFLSYH